MSDNSYASRTRSLSKITAEGRIDKKHCYKVSNEDTRSIIVFGENENSIDSSCIEDFAPFNDIKSIQSNDMRDIMFDEQN
jgi:hypothetical protein